MKNKKILLIILIIFISSILSGCNLFSSEDLYPEAEIKDIDIWGDYGEYTITVELENDGGEGDVMLDMKGIETGYPPEEHNIGSEIFPVPADSGYIAEFKVEGNITFWKFHFELYNWNGEEFEKADKMEDVKPT